MPKADFHPETQAIRGQYPRANREHSVPLYLTSSFVFEDAEQARALFADEQQGEIYTRFSNPNNDEFIGKLAAMEGMEAGLATASGMAAMFGSLAGLLHQGDHLIVSRAVFGSTHQIVTQLLPRWGIEATYVELDDPATWKAALRPNTKIFFAETPSNPGLALLDLQAAGQFAAAHGLILNIDNCFATPWLQNPAHFGAHLVTHSATKWIDGQGRTVGGAILGSAELIKQLRFFARHAGPAMSPFNGWVLSKSLETLHVRMDRHCHNALALAQWLEGELVPSHLEQVRYPYLPSHPQYDIALRQMKAGGGIVTFRVKGGYERAVRFLNALTWFSHTANLGDARTICTHPASTTHSKLSPEEQAAVGIAPGTIRISVGLEHLADIRAEILQALQASA